MSIFTSKKVWKFLVTIQLTNSDPKRTGGGKCPASCQLGLTRSRASHDDRAVFMDDIKKLEKKNVGLIDAREYSTVSSTKNDVLLGF